MLKNIHIQGYKSLFDVSIDLEPLTVFIGANGSGKSNVLEALQVIGGSFSSFVGFDIEGFNRIIHQTLNKSYVIEKFWQGDIKNSILLECQLAKVDLPYKILVSIIDQLVHEFNETQSSLYSNKYGLKQTYRVFFSALKKYDFNPASMTSPSKEKMSSTGAGITKSLEDILYDDREKFSALESQFVKLIPNIKRIALKRDEPLYLVDKFSDHKIPASDISDGTLRILGFLAALYDVDQPSIICFEEPENGIHPWLLYKMMAILQDVAENGIAGKPVQILITTHSPILLNYVKPEQIRAVELNEEGKTQVHKLPSESAQFNATMEAFEGEMGELWFSNVIKANPEA